MKTTILWIDDEIDLLKPYTIFLEGKGYGVTCVSNGSDALDILREQTFDIVFLDENMPGMSGLDTLKEINRLRPSVPVVMITKSEEENIMDMAIGRKMTDYLIKPVNPNQILLTLKKHLHKREITTEQLTDDFRRAFASLSMQLSDRLTHAEWVDIYKRLTAWDLNLNETGGDLHELLKSLFDDANRLFAKTVQREYVKWVNDKASRPMMSCDVMQHRVLPLLDSGKKVFLLVLDNFRYDQWRVCQNTIADFYNIDAEEIYFSILPTVTGYARNSLFAGLMPNQIREMYAQYWVDDEDEEGKNRYENELIGTFLARFRRSESYAYHKINTSRQVEELIQNLHQYKNRQLNVAVVNFVDMLSHARTENNMIRELAANTAAYRSLTQSWVRHSSIYQLFKTLADEQYTVIITTDHGSVLVDKPVKVVGDKSTTTCLRYKHGRSLSYNPKEVLVFDDPRSAGLPQPNVSSKYIFALQNTFFAYPNNFNYYVSHYKETFQHGGVSMEEMMIPLVTLSPKS